MKPKLNRSNRAHADPTDLLQDISVQRASNVASPGSSALLPLFNDLGDREFDVHSFPIKTEAHHLAVRKPFSISKRLPLVPARALRLEPAFHPRHPDPATDHRGNTTPLLRPHQLFVRGIGGRGEGRLDELEVHREVAGREWEGWDTSRRCDVGDEKGLRWIGRRGHFDFEWAERVAWIRGCEGEVGEVLGDVP